MLDIGFFDKEKQPVYEVEVSEGFLLQLARTEFSKIGEERTVESIIDGESFSISLVPLNQQNRRSFVDFFTEEALANTRLVLAQMEQTSPQSELVYGLRKLLELLDCFKNEDHQYLRRI